MLAPPSKKKSKTEPRPWMTLFLVGLGSVLPFWQHFIGRIVLHRDTAMWVFPARWFVRQSLLSGEFPAWNPYQGLGFPTLADPQYGIFYPPHWLFLLVPGALAPHLTSWLSLGHLVFGGTGMALLTRRLGACATGAAVAGLAWALSGHTTSAWAVGPLLLGEAWIPWVARGFLDLARVEGRAPLAGAAWPMALSLLVGEPFMSAMGLVFAAVVVLAAGQGWRPTRGSLHTVVRSAAAWTIAVAIAAVSWLPTLRMVATTERAQPFSRDAAEMYSHHPLRVLEMVLPGALSDPTGEYPARQWVGEPGAARAPLFFSSYLGIVVVALALLGFRRRRLPIVLAGFALLALLVAFGKHLPVPVHEVWRRILFPFAHMHSPEKYVVLVAAPVSLLAGLGASEVMGGTRARPWRFCGFAIVLTLLLATIGAIFPDVLASDMRTATVLGIVMLGLLYGLLLLARRRPRVAGFAMVALVVWDLGFPANRLTGFGSAAVLTTVPPAAAAVLADANGGPAPPRLYREPNVDDHADPLPANATWRDSQDRAVRTLTPNTLNVFGLGVVPSYASAVSDTLADVKPRGYEELGRMFRLLSIPYVLASDPVAVKIGQMLPVGFLAHPLPAGAVVRIHSVLPRVYLPRQVRRLPPAELVHHLRDEAVAAGDEALVSDDRAPLPAEVVKGQLEGCALESYAFTRIVARCESAMPNLAVFVEQYDPGWTATVDGRPTSMVRTNGFMRGVPIPAGDHKIELAYRTPGLQLSVGLSLAGLLLWLALARLRKGRGLSEPIPRE